MVKTTGTVKWFNNPKGWGFIHAQDGEDVFVHYKNIIGTGRLLLVEGETVDFDLEQGPRGRIATNVFRRGGPVAVAAPSNARPLQPPRVAVVRPKIARVG